MTMTLNNTTVVPSGPDTAYVITRPVGCTPATSSLTTHQISFDDLTLGTLTVAPKGISLLVTPVTVVGGHVGLAFNIQGSQTVTPPVFGAGVGVWTHGNGLFFNHNGNIEAEAWHINPGTSQESGQWLDTAVIGTWIPGHTYQVDIALYADGHYSYRILDMTYKLNAGGKPDPNAMEPFHTTLASGTDPDPNIRIRAKTVTGRSNKIAAFIAGAGCSITVKPLAIYN